MFNIILLPPRGQPAAVCRHLPPDPFRKHGERASDITREMHPTSRVFYIVNRRDVKTLSRVMSDGLHA